MPSPDKNSKTLTQAIEEERLQAWREKRAKIAEASRQERIKQAEAERRDRLATFEAEKAKRIKDAAEKRAQEEALRVANRMTQARSRIAGRTDIEAARKRLLAHRRRAARHLALRLSVCVLCPTLAVAIYLFTIATPLYTSDVQFALISAAPQAAQANATPFAATPLSREAALLGAVLMSPGMQTELDRKNRFTDHLSAPEIDPIRRIGGPLGLLNGRTPLENHIDVSVNGQDGIISIRTRASDPETAQAFSITMLDFAKDWMASPNSESNKMRIVTPPTLASTPTFPQLLPTLLLAFLGFLSLYAILATFARTLIRHADH